MYTTMEIKDYHSSFNATRDKINIGIKKRGIISLIL